MVHFGTDHCNNSRLPKDLIVAASLSVNCHYLSAVRGSVIKIELLSLLTNDLHAIIRDYVVWSLTGNRKQKNV